MGDDPASRVYVNNKKKACEYVGFRSFEYALPESTTEDELLKLVKKLNDDDNVNGILVQLPLPKHINEEAVINTINPKKDVDAFHPQNVGKIMTGDYDFLPCTPAGVMELIKESGIDPCGKECVVLGRSNIVGKPQAMLLLHANGTVTICHSKTKNLKDITKRADILVAAIGIIPPLPRSSAKREREDGSPSIERLRDRGFLVLTDPSQLDTLSRGPVMGFFADGHLPKMSEGRGDYLERATRKALEILSREAGERDRGFILMVEGSQIDLRAHDNDAEGVLAEMRDFDRAVAAAMDFADRHPGTLVVVTADHETGGLSIPSANVDFEHEEAGIEYRFSTGGHTAAMVPVYLYGTGSERINGVLDNTELAHMLKRQVLPDNRRSVSAMKIKSSKIIHLIHKTVRSYFCQACR